MDSPQLVQESSFTLHPLLWHFLSVLRSDKSLVFSVETVMSDLTPQHFFVIGVVYQTLKTPSSLSNLNNAAIKKSRPWWLIIKMHQAKHFLVGFLWCLLLWKREKIDGLKLSMPAFL